MIRVFETLRSAAIVAPSIKAQLVRKEVALFLGSSEEGSGGDRHHDMRKVEATRHRGSWQNL